MKVLVLCALVAAAAAWPGLGLDFAGYQADEASAEVSLAQKQHDINLLLHKLYEPLHDEKLKTLAETHDPEADHSKCTDGGVAVHKLMQELRAERVEKKGGIATSLNSEEAVMLFEALMQCKDWETLISNAAYFRERMNEGVFMYGMYAVVRHSSHCEHVVLPPVYEIIPHFFTDNRVIHEAYKAKMTGTSAKLGMNFTSTMNNPEQRVAYFAEDIGLSTHYATWHMDYPFWWKDSYGPHMARKGELFFWIHHQLMNRYDAERISNHLELTEPIRADEPLKEGYAPQISHKNGVPFPSRPDNHMLENVEGFPMIYELVHLEDRIRDAIDHGYITAKDGSIINIKNKRGVALLGDIIESSMHSPNPEYYGSFNHIAHQVIARQADPQGKYGMPPGVMEHYIGATRDPSFYRLHKRIDNLFRKHKDSLPPYTREELEFSGVAINNVAIEGRLETYFEDYEFSLANVFDDGAESDEEISTYIPRLRHRNFHFNVDVLNNNDDEVLATVRIFAWPLRDSNGVELSFNEARWHAIEMDKFWKHLTPGENHIVRKGSESSVTVPDVPSAKTLMSMTEEALAAGTELHLEKFESATGLPNRLLLPKGNKAGMEFMLVVAVTDGAADAAMEDLPTMTKFHHYGVKGVIPDNKPFGYPLDRRVPDERVFHELPNFKELPFKVYNHGVHVHHH